MRVLNSLMAACLGLCHEHPPGEIGFMFFPCPTLTSMEIFVILVPAVHSACSLRRTRLLEAMPTVLIPFLVGLMALFQATVSPHCQPWKASFALVLIHVLKKQ